MKRVTVVLSLIVIAVSDISACDCVVSTFEEEVEKSKKIFHGKVISAEYYTHLIEIKKVWKGEFLSDTFKLVQGTNTCEKRVFRQGWEYLFFLEDSSVINCSRTNLFYVTFDSFLLDGIEENYNKDSATNFSDEELNILKEFLKHYNVSVPDDIIDKKILFAVEDSVVSKVQYFKTHNWARPFLVDLVSLEPDVYLLWLGTNVESSLEKIRKKLELK
ncbi:hypothetical protein QA601_02300 [Chitinispirillales bacterium ANBcel5]|uniref:hypothetical protein n=1 Tax=Cellulosispirillum alkaliphilum TaxID=3039283 RepID=UPI002A4ED13C|nr:hypothetical protein [Chitinispirillales bacterium ANBcel5]